MRALVVIRSLLFSVILMAVSAASFAQVGISVLPTIRTISLGGLNREARERATFAGSAFFVSWTASQIDAGIASRL